MKKVGTTDVAKRTGSWTDCMHPSRHVKEGSVAVRMATVNGLPDRWMGTHSNHGPVRQVDGGPTVTMGLSGRWMGDPQ